MKKNLRSETIFYGISKYSTVVITLLTSSVLARLLTPKEHGVVTVITVFTAFFSIIADLGLGTAVIQNKSLSEDETNDIFSFSVLTALALGTIFLLLGPIVSVIYENKIYIRICALLSIAVFFNAMNIIPNALLMKSKRFKLVGMRLIVVAVVTGAVAIIMALVGCSYYSLVVQSISQAVLIFLWNFVNIKLRFKLKFNFDSIRKVSTFSAYQFSYNFINYFARNLDNLLIGKVMGDENLAYYDKGYKLMMYPVQNLTYVINPIIHPVLSEYQNDKRYIYDSYLKIVRVLSIIGVFITFFCFWGSKEIILLFFGKQWNESIPVFQLLSLSVWPQLVSSSAGSIYQSSGNTKLMFKSGLVHFSLTIGLIIVGLITHNLPVIACLVTISLYCRFFIDYYFLVVKNFRFSYISFLMSFSKEVIIAICLIITIVVLYRVNISNLMLSLIFKGATLGVVYFAIGLVTGQLKNILALLRKRQ